MHKYMHKHTYASNKYTHVKIKLNDWFINDWLINGDYRGVFLLIKIRPMYKG